MLFWKDNSISWQQKLYTKASHGYEAQQELDKEPWGLSKFVHYRKYLKHYMNISIQDMEAT